MQRSRVFLTAEWRWLVMLNWPVEPELLAPYLSPGLELDLWHGRPYVSVVGFLFRDTRLLGWAIPRHREFEELNLRFYVRARHNAAQRGVCFIREIVPRRAVSWVARTVYNENYATYPMRHKLLLNGERLGESSIVEYQWRVRGRWNGISARAFDLPTTPRPGTPEEYFIENYWGFTAQRDGGLLCYRVEHPPWTFWPTIEAAWDCDVCRLYGPEWNGVLGTRPESAFLIEGSAVKVHRGEKLETPA